METTKLLTSKITLYFLVVVLLIICSLLSYAIFREAEISSSKDCWLKITPKGNGRIEELEENLAGMTEKYRSVSSKYEQIAKIVGADKKEGDGVVSAVELMCVRERETGRDTNYSLSVIRTEVYRARTVNTRSPAIDQTAIGLYKHIQKFFRAVGIYNGKIDVHQAATCSAVMQFQAEYGLEVDGIIGEKTLGAMACPPKTVPIKVRV